MKAGKYSRFAARGKEPELGVVGQFEIISFLAERFHTQGIGLG
jgi:hypothetical protein